MADCSFKEDWREGTAMSLRKLRKPQPECPDSSVTDESGQGLAEYALILGLVAAVCIGALSGLGGAIASSPGFTALF